MIRRKAAGQADTDLPLEIKVTDTEVASGLSEHPYPRFEGYVTLLKPHLKGYEIKYKLNCLVNDRKRVDSSSIMVSFGALNVGEETKWYDGLTEYDLRGASQCEVTFTYGPMYRDGQTYTLLTQKVSFTKDE